MSIERVNQYRIKCGEEYRNHLKQLQRETNDSRIEQIRHDNEVSRLERIRDSQRMASGKGRYVDIKV